MTNNVGDHIRRLRTDRGYKQAFPPKAVGVSQGKISRIEWGTTDPSFDEMARIAQVLEYPLDSFAKMGPLSKWRPKKVR